MKKKLLIIGASGHGKVVADIALQMRKWQSIVFLDDNEDIKTVMGLDVVGKSTDASNYIQDHDIFIAIGNNAVRENIHRKLREEGASIPTLIHPNAIIGERVNLAFGTVIMAGVVINCCTTIGEGCIINTGSTIDHDNIIEDFAHISPGVHLAGTVKIGQGSWLGTGCIVGNNVSIVGDCILGAGAVVIKDVDQPGTYVGVPVRRIS
ncbi:acetyltransferase [Cytobacillus firmus]|uniref:acetyltransferase n=1 Tax=Cytobacillus firmus TaxID=1399 RepID=UPI0021616AD2|nr:acetyltransferase [Cytobacillus firmus]MCS0670400.1 acetyltransferase [Cytobacillus firmus]